MTLLTHQNHISAAGDFIGDSVCTPILSIVHNFNYNHMIKVTCTVE